MPAITRQPGAVNESSFPKKYHAVFSHYAPSEADRVANGGPQNHGSY